MSGQSVKLRDETGNTVSITRETYDHLRPGDVVMGFNIQHGAWFQKRIHIDGICMVPIPCSSKNDWILCGTVEGKDYTEACLGETSKLLLLERPGMLYKVNDEIETTHGKAVVIALDPGFHAAKYGASYLIELENGERQWM